MNKYLKIILYILAMMFGIFIFIYGGYDDSPGAQLLGVIFFVLGMVGLIKIRKNKINN